MDEREIKVLWKNFDQLVRIQLTHNLIAEVYSLGLITEELRDKLQKGIFGIEEFIKELKNTNKEALSLFIAIIRPEYSWLAEQMEADLRQISPVTENDPSTPEGRESSSDAQSSFDEQWSSLYTRVQKTGKEMEKINITSISQSKETAVQLDKMKEELNNTTQRIGSSINFLKKEEGIVESEASISCLEFSVSPPKLFVLSIRKMDNPYYRDCANTVLVNVIDLVYDKYHPNEKTICNVGSILKKIVQNFHSYYGNETKDLIEVWPGYAETSELPRRRNLRLVIIHTDDFNGEKIQNFQGIQCIWRLFTDVNTEAKLAVSETIICLQHREIEPIQLRHMDFDSLRQNHSNLTMLSWSPVKSIGYGTAKHSHQQQKCIVFYCHVKGVIPFGENPFPQHFNGYDTDVREGYCTFAAGPSGLQMGDTIGPNNRSWGTVGGFVDLPDNKSGLITCAHVALPSDALLNVDDFLRSNEVQMYSPPQDRAIGKVSRSVFRYGSEDETSVDAALIQLYDSNAVDGTFISVPREQLGHAGFDNAPRFRSGEILAEIPTLSRGNSVIKFGSSTKLTLGILLQEGSHVKAISKRMEVDNRYSFWMHKQMEVLSIRTPLAGDDTFVTNGDSGAFVFMLDRSAESDPELKCIGMAIASTSYGSCLMTPIKSVLEALDLPMELKAFGPSQGMEEASGGQPRSESLTDKVDRVIALIKKMDSKLGTLEQDMRHTKEVLQKNNLH